MRKLILALCAIAVVVGGTTFGLAQAQQEEPPAFSAYPVPGTLTASAKTAISFRGGTADELGDITVTGSRSGRHTGRLRAHSDGDGVSFVPSNPFVEGERVTVRTARHIIGTRHGDFTFNIGDLVRRKTRPVDPPSVGVGTVQKYASRPGLSPPEVAVTTSKPGVAPGYIFLAPKGGRGQDGPMIIDNRGRLVWFKPMKRLLATDFRVQNYFGKPALTWWQGKLRVGDGEGVGVVYDQDYRRIATVRAGNGYKFDTHEFTITPRNTAIVLAYARYRRDLRPWGGPDNSIIVDNILQEIDLKTGLVMFEWHSFGNVSPSESNVPPPRASRFEWEYFHINSAEVTPDGNFLISARNTSGIYKISRATGRIIWRLGGAKSDFKLGKGVRFDWQHSAREQPDGTLMLYDNSAAPPRRKASRVLTIKLDERAKTATLVRALKHPRKLLSASQGSVQRLPNGDTFVGWGSQRWFTEFGPDGQVLLDGRIARGNDSYRAFRFEWSGTPKARPRAVASASGGRITARASWNGATDLASWQLLAGDRPDALVPVGASPSAGFETAITITGNQPYVAMRALDASGQVLATSKAVKPR